MLEGSRWDSPEPGVRLSSFEGTSPSFRDSFFIFRMTSGCAFLRCSSDSSARVQAPLSDFRLAETVGGVLPWTNTRDVVDFRAEFRVGDLFTRTGYTQVPGHEVRDAATAGVQPATPCPILEYRRPHRPRCAGPRTRHHGIGGPPHLL